MLSIYMDCINFIYFVFLEARQLTDILERRFRSLGFNQLVHVKPNGFCFNKKNFQSKESV